MLKRITISDKTELIKKFDNIYSIVINNSSEKSFKKSNVQVTEASSSIVSEKVTKTRKRIKEL